MSSEESERRDVYLKGVALFIKREKSGENDRLLKAMHKKSLKARGDLVSKEFGPMLVDFFVRPIGKFDTDELEVFCRAFRVGWNVWPDCWVGVLMMLDYMAEKFSTDDIDRLDPETLKTVKHIANTKSWPNNETCGAQLSTSAKNILGRHSRSMSFEDVTEYAWARNMAVMCSSPNPHEADQCL